jgi:hypothetical protein
MKDFVYKFDCNTEQCFERAIDFQKKTFDANPDSRCGANCQTQVRSLFDIFNNPTGVTHIYPIGKTTPSLSYNSAYKLKEFYEREAQKYGANFTLTIETKGPYDLLTEPPNEDPPDLEVEELHPGKPTPRNLGAPSGKTLQLFFDAEAQKQNIDFSKYDIINYVYFTSGEGRFTSTIGSERKAFTHVFISYDAPRHTLQTMIHETGHVLGAGDLYAGFICLYPDGFAEPDKQPLYPQTKACVMCGNIPLSEREALTQVPYEDIILCDKTAEEFGWK